MTISIGSWMIPAALMLLAFVGVRIFGPRMKPQDGGMFPDMGGALLELLCYALAAIFSLGVWLIWALVT